MTKPTGTEIARQDTLGEIHNLISGLIRQRAILRSAIRDALDDPGGAFGQDRLTHALKLTKDLPPWGDVGATPKRQREGVQNHDQATRQEAGAQE